MAEVVAAYPTKGESDIIEFYYNWKFHEPDYSRWQSTKRQIDIMLVSDIAFMYQRHRREEPFRAVASEGLLRQGCPAVADHDTR